jgi:dUTP pyrophosphatase
MEHTIKFVKNSKDAITPERKTIGSAGYDLFSADDIKILPLSRMCVSIGLSISLPNGFFGRILPRSSLSLKCIDIGAGVIDEDYIGIIKVLVINNNPHNIFYIEKGMSIAQLVIERYYTPKFENVLKLDETIRGENGFGSTGK